MNFESSEDNNIYTVNGIIYILYSVVIYGLYFGVSIAIQIITARRIGEKNFLLAKNILYVSIFWVLLISGLFSIFGWFYSDKIASIFVSEGSIFELTSDYLRYRFLGIVAYALILVFRGYFDGIGMTFVGMAAAIISTITNVFLNWVSIYGYL
ncbi:MAG: MATE family efflux transporter [Leptospirales bacterium]